MWPKTLHDAIADSDQPETLEEYAVFPADAQGTTYTVVAPCCGRRTAADTVLDARSVPEIGGWACDGCWTRTIRNPNNPLTRPSLFEQMGAPPDVVEHYRARELAAQRIDAKRRSGDGWREDEEYQQAVRDVRAS